ncbi:HD family hydrolase [Morganella morganii]|uniref:HD family hydrolase n=1 Tax=Morganella morganii TaxID=582 RepID=UPI00228E219C|nr:HD family hydrolase [Morganella morganii]EKQ1114474.1 HD family hydrolase [Morganella morganii]MDE2538647.1 HD family hydrolase [Morganella morganii]HCL5897847.1 HD family hydrolase [Morganella morganii]HCU1241939.1 HD family hydrolase [Morganella morganii]
MSYIATSTGKHIDFTNITPDQICIEDIARGLSNECRFAGQLESFYSVAQHSVYVSQIVPPECALEALLHDAAEAYIKDIPSPLKAMLPDYKAVEKRIEAVIREKFGLPPVMTVDVHYADLVMLATEKRDFEIDPGSHWPMLDSAPPHDDIIIQPLTPPQAYHQFMARFEMLITSPFQDEA